MGLERATIDGLRILANGGGLVGEVATLREDLRSVDVVCLIHGFTIAQKWGFCKPLCASSVVVPRLADAATGTTGEPAVFYGLSLTTVGGGTVERRLDRVDSVAVAINVVH